MEPANLILMTFSLTIGAVVLILLANRPSDFSRRTYEEILLEEYFHSTEQQSAIAGMLVFMLLLLGMMLIMISMIP